MANRDPAADERRGTLTPVTEFLQTETASGIVLLAAAIGALVWANASPTGYDDFWTQHLNVVIDESLQHWINDALMAVFFFVVGLEIKRELVVGDLRDRAHCRTPRDRGLGWHGRAGAGVPGVELRRRRRATAGAFRWRPTSHSRSVCSHSCRSRVPSTLRLFLLTLAIVDDVGAILVIAVVYTDDLAAGWLVGAAAALVVMLGLRALRVGSATAYVLPAVALWYALYESGVHATIAGVIVGLLTPARCRRGRQPGRAVGAPAPPLLELHRHSALRPGERGGPGRRNRPARGSRKPGQLGCHHRTGCREDRRDLRRGGLRGPFQSGRPARGPGLADPRRGGGAGRDRLHRVTVRVGTRLWG